MIKRLGELLRRAVDVWQTEGFVRMVNNGIQLARPWIFQWQKCYLYEHTIRERNEADFVPNIHNYTLKIIRNVREAEELETSNGLNILRRLVNARRGLDKGAILFCVFVDYELAHTAWVALCEDAKNTFDPLPYKVDFANYQACTGGTETLPKFRGKGLMKYGYYKRFEYLMEQGVTVSRNAVAIDNLASQKVHAKFSPRKYAEVRHLRLLRCTVYYKEWPL